jgi:hypothetical protein
MDDPKLSELLKEWQVPNAPASLDARVLNERKPWWSFLFTGSIRLPVPVFIAFAAALIVMAFALMRKRSEQPVAATPVSLAEFRPVKDLNVRIIRGQGDVQ